MSHNSTTQINTQKTFTKKHYSEYFLTYRRRMARLATVQAVSMFEFNMKNNHFDKSITINEAIKLSQQDTIYFYQNVFFDKNFYGTNELNYKMDEVFMCHASKDTIINIDKIDRMLSDTLPKSWPIKRLDSVVLNVLRCGINELLSYERINYKITISEYVRVLGCFFNDKKLGFANAILDSVAKKIRVTRDR